MKLTEGELALLHNKVYVTSGRGRNSGRALSKEQVIDIREKYASGKFTYKKLGEMYDITSPAIGAIINRRSYHWVS